MLSAIVAAYLSVSAFCERLVWCEFFRVTLFSSSALYLILGKTPPPSVKVLLLLIAGLSEPEFAPSVVPVDPSSLLA